MNLFLQRALPSDLGIRSISHAWCSALQECMLRPFLMTETRKNETTAAAGSFHCEKTAVTYCCLVFVQATLPGSYCSVGHFFNHP